MKKTFRQKDKILRQINPLIISRKKRWVDWERWLQDEAVPPRKRLLEALNHANLPPNLLHQFAHDCVTQLIKKSPYIGHLTTQTLLRFVSQKQKLFVYTETERDKQTIAQKMNKNHQLAYEFARNDASIQEQYIAFAVAWSLSPEPTIAARYASKNVSLDEERHWHCRHLIALIKELQAARKSFLFTCKQRQASLDGVLGFWKKEYERPLF